MIRCKSCGNSLFIGCSASAELSIVCKISKDKIFITGGDLVSLQIFREGVLSETPFFCAYCNKYYSLKDVIFRSNFTGYTGTVDDVVLVYVKYKESEEEDIIEVVVPPQIILRSEIERFSLERNPYKTFESLTVIDIKNILVIGE